MAFPRITKIYGKGERAPGEYWASMNNWFIFYFHEIHFLTPQLCICGSIYIHATPLHQNKKLHEAIPRTGRTLFWVTTPLRHIAICVWGGEEFSTYLQTTYVTAVQLPYFPQRLYLYLKDVFSMLCIEDALNVNKQFRYASIPACYGNNSTHCYLPVVGTYLSLLVSNNERP